jgi:hypothetical protein
MAQWQPTSEFGMGRLLKRTRGGPQCVRNPDSLKLALERSGAGRHLQPRRLLRVARGRPPAQRAGVGHPSGLGRPAGAPRAGARDSRGGAGDARGVSRTWVAGMWPLLSRDPFPKCRCGPTWMRPPAPTSVGSRRQSSRAKREVFLSLSKMLWCQSGCPHRSPTSISRGDSHRRKPRPGDAHSTTFRDTTRPRVVP